MEEIASGTVEYIATIGPPVARSMHQMHSTLAAMHSRHRVSSSHVPVEQQLEEHPSLPPVQQCHVLQDGAVPVAMMQATPGSCWCYVAHVLYAWSGGARVPCAA